MQKILAWLDEIAGIKQENTLALWLERAAFVFLILMVVAAPHSIAATQTAWLTGMFLWVIRLFIRPRPRLVRTPLDVPLWAFFIWSVITALTSYAPDISLDKLRNAALFLIFYFVINNLRNIRAVRFLTYALIFSCLVNVIWTPVERIIGRGVEIHGIAAESPLAKALLWEGDTLLEANGKKLKTPDDLASEIERNDLTKVQFYRPDFYFTVEVKRENLLTGENSLERLGITGWKKSRNWRSAGFYGHYTTYAEILQLLAALVFGLLVASFLARKRENERQRTKDEGQIIEDQRPKTKDRLFLLFSLIGMLFALLLTVTRGSQLAFLISAFTIVLAVGSRKLLLTLAAVVLPLALVGLFFLQQSRQVGFFDTKDGSITWRQTVYREGFDLWTRNARNFTLGVGMDSIKRYAAEWHLFDDGRLPPGHFHSTPLQLVVERGFPALLLWLWVLWIYARALWTGIQNSKFKIQNSEEDSALRMPHSAFETGVLLGCFGGLIGFFTSGLVHYNLGDAEVAMVFFLLMGFGTYVGNAKLKVKN